MVNDALGGLNASWTRLGPAEVAVLAGTNSVGIIGGVGEVGTCGQELIDIGALPACDATGAASTGTSPVVAASVDGSVFVGLAPSACGGSL
jgi:hypothetical protein